MLDVGKRLESIKLSTGEVLVGMFNGMVSLKQKFCRH